MKTPAIPLDWVPTLTRRYATTVIDGLLVVAVIVVPNAVWPEDDVRMRYVRLLIALVCIFVYEPVCTGRFVTVGQRFTRVRVRRVKDGEKIGILRAYGRIIFKILFGVFSFLTIPFTRGRRAIHDMATGSIVIMAAAESAYVAWATSPAEVNDPDGRGDDPGA